MSDFKSYNQNRQSEGADGLKNQGTEQKSGSGQPDPQATANLAAEIAKAFYGKSQKDVWQTILAQAEEGKRNGTLTNEDLDNFYKTVYPLVDGVKRQKLKSIIAKLKEI
ncbi:MAG: hypothetical protein ACI4MC_03635 [Candidatus Coproplasma sp.]